MLDKNKSYIFYRLLQLRLSKQLEINNSVIKNLMYSLAQDKYMVLERENGSICAYVLWADVNSFTRQRYKSYGVLPQYPEEWDEGRNCLVLDVVLENPDRKSMFSMVSSLKNRSERIIYRKNNVFYNREYANKKAE